MDQRQVREDDKPQAASGRVEAGSTVLPLLVAEVAPKSEGGLVVSQGTQAR